MDYSVQDKLKAILDNTTDSIVLLDEQARVLCANKSIQYNLFKLRGKYLQEGDNYRDFVAPESAEIFEKLFVRAIQGEYVVVEHESIGQDFSIWFEFRLNPVYSDENALIGVSMTASVIDERKRAELALRNSEEKFRKIIEFAPNPILICDNKSIIRMLNPEACHIFGYTKEEILGQPIGILSAEFKMESDAPFLAGLKKKDGSQLVVEVSQSLFAVGNESLILIMLKDETEHLVQEKKMHKANQELDLLNKVNDLILLHQTEQSLLSEISRVSVIYGGYKLAWFAFQPKKDDPEKWVIPMYAFGETNYLEKIKISLNDPELSKGPTATVLREGIHVVTNDVSNSSNFKPWLEFARKYKIGASCVIPVFVNGKVEAALNIYSEDTHAFNAREVNVLTRMANNLSLAISHIRLGMEKEHAQYQLNERIKELRTIYEVSSWLQKPNQDESKLIQAITQIIPAGWQFPEICHCRLSIYGRTYFSSGFKESNIQLHAHIVVQDARVGLLEVMYESKSTVEVLHPFLKEEKELIFTLGDMISVYLTKKATDEKLIRSEANLASVFKNTDVGHMLLNKELEVIDFNQKFSEGYLESTGIQIQTGHKFRDIILPEKQSDTANLLEQVIRSKKVHGYDTRYQYNNKIFYYNISLAPIIENDEVAGFCLSAIDITERKEKELERQHMLDDLLQRNQELQQFAFIVSHNIRAPLSNILGITNLLNHLSEPDEIQFAKDGLQKSAQNLDQVLHDLKDILHIRSAFAEHKTLVNLNEILAEVKSALSREIDESKAQIQYSFGDQYEIQTIKSYLINILHQLILNSIKFAQKGQAPKIDIRTERKQDKMVLSVKDNGRGMDLNRHGESVFGLYKRFHPEVEGKGLGLLMVKTQVEAIQGKIEIESTPGKGTQVTITIPLF